MLIHAPHTGESFLMTPEQITPEATAMMYPLIAEGEHRFPWFAEDDEECQSMRIAVEFPIFDELNLDSYARLRVLVNSCFNGAGHPASSTGLNSGCFDRIVLDSISSLARIKILFAAFRSRSIAKPHAGSSHS